MQNLPRGKGLRSAVVRHQIMIWSSWTFLLSKPVFSLGSQGKRGRTRSVPRWWCVYAYTASNIYGTKIVKGMPAANVGKVIVLGLGITWGRRSLRAKF